MPTPITSPFMSDVSPTRWPFTSVPLVDPRSTSEKPSPMRRISAWRRDTLGSSTTMSHSLGTADHGDGLLERQVAAVPHEQRPARGAAAAWARAPARARAPAPARRPSSRRAGADRGWAAAPAARRGARSGTGGAGGRLGGGGGHCRGGAGLSSPRRPRADRDAEHPDGQVVLGLERDDGARRGAVALAAGVLDQVLLELVAHLRLVGRELLAVGRVQVDRVRVRDVDAVDRDRAVVVHLLGQLAGQLDGLDRRSERATEEAFDKAPDPPFDVAENAHGGQPRRGVLGSAAALGIVVRRLPRRRGL